MILSNTSIIQLIEVIKTTSSLFIFFLRKDLTRTKKQQAQTSDFYPFRVAHAKSCCLCGFLFAYFCFVSWFLHVYVFVRLKFVCKNRLEIALIASITYSTHTILMFPPISPTLLTLVRQPRQPRQRTVHFTHAGVVSMAPTLARHPSMPLT